jgi:hypothetical protein
LTKLRLVEILVPPAAVGAANAVQRPHLVRHRTGDPDARAYLLGRGTSTFIPLRDIEVERSGGMVIARAAGRRIWPVYHATRVPIGPWLPLAEALLEASPPAIRGGRRDLRHAMAAIGGERLPAVVAEGGLVLSPAEWRLDALPWAPGQSLSHRVRALTAFRANLDLPRFVMVSRPGVRAEPCDLESLRGLATLERASRSGARISIEAMTPDVDHLWLKVGPRGRGRVTSTMFRLPHGRPPAVAAAEAASRLTAWVN